MTTKTAKPIKPATEAAEVKQTKASSQPVSSKAKPDKPEKKSVSETIGEAVKEKLASKKKNDSPKVVRDSFSFPKSDYRKITELKSKCLAMGVQAKKSEILRAGLLVLETLSDEDLKYAIGQVENLKTGRPLKSIEKADKA